MSSKQIQPIDRGSVHRICSGQVILSLATAVKELVENSIDAGATCVDIRLKDHGIDCIEVIDNGCGVEEVNFEGLTLKHHTSKLQDFSDLVNVETFGFRGEALSSLCALSKVSVITCHKDVNVGAKLEFDHNGHLVSKTACPRQHGTTVCLQNLFSTMPVRHKEFQRNIKKEFNKMIQILNAYCIISSGVRISCTNQLTTGKKNIVINTNGNKTIRDNITNIFGARQVQTLVEFEPVAPDESVCEEYGIKCDGKENLFNISGFVSNAMHGNGRSNTDRQFFFINKRPCDLSKVTRIVNEVYHSYNRQQYPFVVLDISINKESVDVNVTPDKRQIFLQHEKLLYAVIKSSLSKLLEPHAAVFAVNQAQTPAGTRKPLLGAMPLFHQWSSPAALEGGSKTPVLSNLKRSFSSAFDRNQGTASAVNTTPKQPCLDSFITRAPVQDFDASTPSVDPAISTNPSKSSNISDTKTQQSTRLQEISDSSFVELPSNIETPTHSENHRDTGTESSKTNDHDESSSKYALLKDKMPVVNMQFNSPIAASTQNALSDEQAFENIESKKDEVRILFQKESVSGEKENENGLSRNQDRFVAGCDNNVNEFVADISRQICDSVSSEVKNCSTEQDSFTVIMKSNQDAKLKKKQSGEVRKKLKSTEIDKSETFTRKEVVAEFSMGALKEKMQQKQKDGISDGERWCRSFRAKINPTDNEAAEKELQKEISKDMFCEMRVLGQFNLGFIIAQLGDDLFILDQHAMDEKYNFEQLQKHTVMQSQKLINPQQLELTAANETVVADNLHIFHSNGFDLIIDDTAPSTQRVRLCSMPVSKNWEFGQPDIDELIFMLSESPGIMCRPTRVRMMFASRACRKSIMIGTALNQQQMKKLVLHMGEMEQPWNCPHGRPTMRHLINLKMLCR